MDRTSLVQNIRDKQSFLCIGLDSDIKKIPSFLLKEKDPILKFNKEIIEATHDICVAYKPNIAFYESLGSSGWKTLEDTMTLIPDDLFTIADAKRGDIGNTSAMYARAFFDHMNFDSVTVAPYMGIDSVSPFLEFDDKWVILLALTSNKGSKDFQFMNENGQSLYQRVISQSQKWGTPENLMYVIGATHPTKLKEIRDLAPEHFFLVPGVGAQGGDVNSVTINGANDDIGLLINSSRGIIYASDGKDFAEAARASALKLVNDMGAFF